MRGFRVTVAGGTSTMPRAGALLETFVPASEMFNVAEAIVRVYHKHGDYEHKARNRMKFLIKSLGWERFVEEYDTSWPCSAAKAARRCRSIAEPAGRGRARLAAGRAAERARHHHARASRRCAAPASCRPCSRIRRRTRR